MSIIRDTTIKARKYLERDEILIFAGARQAGKTTILKQIKSELENRGKFCYFLNLEDPEYLELLNRHPKNLFKIFSFDLKQRTFVFIDEIQYLDDPSNFLKYLPEEIFKHPDNNFLTPSEAIDKYDKKKAFRYLNISLRAYSGSFPKETTQLISHVLFIKHLK